MKRPVCLAVLAVLIIGFGLGVFFLLSSGQEDQPEVYEDQITKEQINAEIKSAMTGVRRLGKLDPNKVIATGGTPCGDYFYVVKTKWGAALGYQFIVSNLTAGRGLFTLNKVDTYIDNTLMDPTIEMTSPDPKVARIIVKVPQKIYESEAIKNPAKSTMAPAKCLPPPR